MTTFNGSLRLAADPDSRVRADIELDDERLVVRAGEDQIGDWALADLRFEPAPGGFRLNADGEDLILTTGDNAAFADLVGVSEPPAEEEDADYGDEYEEESPGRFGRLRSRSSANWIDDDTLRSSLASIIAGAAIVLIAGAALSWGDTRLIGDGDGLPWSRIFAALGGVGAAVGAYLGWREQRRHIGAGIAAGGGVIALGVLYLYASEAGLGLGFFVAMVAVVPLTVAAVVGLTRWGAPVDYE